MLKLSIVINTFRFRQIKNCNGYDHGIDTMWPVRQENGSTLRSFDAAVNGMEVIPQNTCKLQHQQCRVASMNFRQIWPSYSRYILENEYENKLIYSFIVGHSIFPLNAFEIGKIPMAHCLTFAWATQKNPISQLNVSTLRESHYVWELTYRLSVLLSICKYTYIFISVSICMNTISVECACAVCVCGHTKGQSSTCCNDQNETSTSKWCKIRKLRKMTKNPRIPVISQINVRDSS